MRAKVLERLDFERGDHGRFLAYAFVIALLHVMHHMMSCCERGESRVHRGN